MKQILMLAAENGAIAGAKVGGMADVIRDLPIALLSQDVLANVIMPGHGELFMHAGAQYLTEIEVSFAGKTEVVGLYRTNNPHAPQAHIYLLKHPLFEGVYGGVYSQGTAERPFAEDATKFALFCSSVATALIHGLLPMPDVLHLHDWHMAMLAMLIAYHPEYKRLQSTASVYTIHNLSLQGIRPLSNEASSFAAWYPEMWAAITQEQRDNICDPRYPHCINPMRIGIRLCSKVHLVSQTYAKEVVLPSDNNKGFFGGEGLEHDLQQKAAAGQLIGILNGCGFGNESQSQGDKRIESPAVTYDLITLAQTQLVRWISKQALCSSQDQIALVRLEQWLRQIDALTATDNAKPLKSKAQRPFLLTSVGRLTDQKVLLLRQVLPSGQTVLGALLQKLQDAKPQAKFVMLGSGDAQIAREFTHVAGEYSNFIFLNGYDEKISDLLYEQGDLFLMPSSFEPCGISQMLALKHGQPCLVHGVGGLKDTIIHHGNGLVFNGGDLIEQAQNMLATFDEALGLYGTAEWDNMRRNAIESDYSWIKPAAEYLKRLYND